MTSPSRDDRAARLRQAIRLKRAAGRRRAPRFSPRPADQPPRLGELQRGLWLLHQLDPRSPAYNLASAFRVSPAPDPERLERGLNRVVSRHRLLRSTFRADRDGVLQIVNPPSPLAVERIEAGDGEALAAAVREARKPFDLEAGPLIRLLLVAERSAGEVLLVLVLHHILADERSLGFLWSELAAAYDGRPSADGPELQYDDYVHWLATRRDPGARAAALDAWRRRLDPLPDDLRLPFERPAGDRRADRGRLLRRSLAPEVRRQIRRLAAATGTTPFTLFALVFRLLLHRTTGGQNLAFATPASRRSHPATAEMIGYFLNPVVVCTAIDEQLSVDRAIRDFSRQMRDLMADASVPFDLLAEELAPRRRRDRHPIFQAMFVYQETPPPPALGVARLEPVSLDLGESKFDLTLFVSESEDSLEVAVEYRTDRFDGVWMENLLGHYATLAGHLAADLERPLAEVPMLPPKEEDRLRAAAQGPPLRLRETALLPRQILDQARRSPAAPAVIGGGEVWSYERLAGAGRRIAGELSRRGVEPGDRVALFLDRSPWMIAGLLGSHWAGAAYVPLDPAYPAARNREVLDDAEVAAVLTRSPLLSRLPDGTAPAIAVEGLDGPGGDGPEAVLAELRGEHPAYVLYTSGSTGRPKGVVVTHANLRASNDARLAVYDPPSSGDREGGGKPRFLLLPSVAFDSSVAGIFGTLAAGGALVIPADGEARDPRRLARLVAEKEVTRLLCIPSLWAHLLAAGGERLQRPPGGRGGDLQLEAVIVAGESCSRELVEEHFRRLPHVRLWNEYGPTEATVWATVEEIERQEAGPIARDPIAIGRPIPGVRVEVLDDLGRRVPAGIPGQGWISGPTVAAGYWRRPELTAERFAIAAGPDTRGRERMYRTGDRLSWTADGRLLFLGRVDEQIKLRGFRIAPGEIEAVLLGFPEIEAAAVVARPPAQLVAFVETAAGDTAGAAPDRRPELARRLPEFMVPSRIVELPELPRLPNGKVDRRRLREMPLGAPEEGLTRGDEAQVLGEREQALVSLWQGLLGRTGVRPSDNFFELGGHSLLVVEMTSAIERDFGVAVPPAEVFQHPTVRQLGALIGERGGSGTPAYAHLFPLQPGGRKSPFIFAVPHFFSQMVAARFRGERPVYGLRGVSLRPEGNRGRWPTMGDLGAELVAEIRRRFPDDAFVIAGYSFGATMAVEAVRQMEERGIPVHRLILIAPMAVDVYRLGPLRAQLDGLRRPLAELSLRQALGLFVRGNHPLTRRPYRRAWRRLAVQPWRRLLCQVGDLRVRAGLPLTPRILHADVRLERFRLHAGYRPGIVRTPTVIFNAREPETDAAATWRPYFEGPFTVHPTPDPHLDEASIAAAKELILHHLRDLED